jgi:hypothetical protein
MQVQVSDLPYSLETSRHLDIFWQHLAKHLL